MGCNSGSSKNQVLHTGYLALDSSIFLLLLLLQRCVYSVYVIVCVCVCIHLRLVYVYEHVCTWRPGVGVGCSLLLLSITWDRDFPEPREQRLDGPAGALAILPSLPLILSLPALGQQTQVTTSGLFFLNVNVEAEVRSSCSHSRYFTSDIISPDHRQCFEYFLVKYRSNIVNI